MVIPKQVTLQIDSREKKPPLFPTAIRVKLPGRPPLYVKINIEKTTMTTGDYRLSENPDCILERKGSISELAQNFLTSDKHRASKAFGRLLQTPQPILLLDFSIAETTVITEGIDTPEEVWDALLMFCCKYPQLRVFMIPPGKSPTGRRRAGEFLVRLLLHNYLRKINNTDLTFPDISGRLSGDNGQIH